MKIVKVLFLSIIALLLTSVSPNLIIPDEIYIEVKAIGEDLEYFDDGIIPWINLERPDYDNLIGSDEIVLKYPKIILLIDYPLTNTAQIEIQPKNEHGFSKKELIKVISDTYKIIYDQEDDTAATKTIPIEERNGIINRNTTDGKWGIWGHDLADLDLSGIYTSIKGNTLYLILMVES